MREVIAPLTILALKISFEEWQPIPVFPCFMASRISEGFGFFAYIRV